MAKSMAASLTDAVRRGYDAARRCDGYGRKCLLRFSRPHRAGPGGSVQPCGPLPRRSWWGGVPDRRERPPPTSSRYPDGTMAFNPTVGWGKDGRAYSIRSALDRERAFRAAGWDTTPLLINDN